jgi:oligoendopeptidase F
MSSKQKNKTEWNLSQLYKSPNDPQIEKDLIYAEKVYADFANKYRNTGLYLKDETALLKALTDYEKLADLPVSKTIFYLHLYGDKDSNNKVVRAKMNLISQRLQKLGNVVVFFEINLSKILPKYQKKFLASEKLSHFRYYLEKIFENGKYVLTESEEKILSLKSLPSHGLWTQGFDKIQNKQTVKHKGKVIPISEASHLIKDLKTQKERKGLYDKVIGEYFELGDIAESELNAIVIDKKINDELRGFKEAYDATILGYENDKESVLNLVKTVTDSFYVSQKFYAVKVKMLKLKKLAYYDRAVSVGITK